MKYSNLAVAVGFVIFGLVGYSVGHQASGSPVHSVAKKNTGTELELQPEISYLAAAIARIEQRLERLETTQPATALQNQKVASSAPGTSTREDVSPHEIREDIAIRKAMEVKRRLTTESRDPFWASATEDQIRRAIADASHEGSSYTITSVSCLTSICNFEVSSATSGNSFEFTHSFMTHIDGIAAFDFGRPIQMADGSYRLGCNIFRKGYQLPDLTGNQTTKSE